MKIRFNKDNILKIIEIGLTGIVLVGGCNLISNNINKNEVKDSKPKMKQERVIENGATEYLNSETSNNKEINLDEMIEEGISDNLTSLNREDITYTAPEGYYLVSSGDRVYAVRKREQIDVVSVEKNELGFYVAPVGYTLVGDKAIKKNIVVDVVNPIIEFGKLIKIK